MSLIDIFGVLNVRITVFEVSNTCGLTLLVQPENTKAARSMQTTKLVFI
jgi:hypothetical protein